MYNEERQEKKMTTKRAQKLTYFVKPGIQNRRECCRSFLADELTYRFRLSDLLYELADQAYHRVRRKTEGISAYR